MTPVRKNVALLLFLAAFLGSCDIATAAATSPDLNSDAPPTLQGNAFLTIPGEQWKLLWHDEFTEKSLDPAKWTIGLPWPGDDGAHRHHNKEYASLIADDDVVFQNGMLELLTRKADVVDARGRTFHYTQAFIQTDRKFSYKYGYCEIRAKVPEEAGPGLWPAFWMLSAGWPPEDDVAEFWTGRPLPHFHQGYAYRLPVSGRVQWNSRHVDQVPLGFHTYGMEWGPGYQLMNMDGKIRVRVYGAQSPNVPMYLILNSGVTSDPAPSPRTVFPNAFVVNYLRVYQRPPVIPLHNAGFEDPTLAPWTASNKACVVADHAHSGHNALCLPGSAAAAEQRIFGLTPNTTYQLTGWADAQGDGEARLGAKFFGAAEIWTSQSTNGYKQLSVSFTTGPHNSTATIYCSRPAGSQSAYFDDIAVSPASSP
ncbi:MAG: family 16 glycosylhydrolase [Tepidisphaeraceae bacterium]|jgi:beta-glucanase (GH16 family)